MVYLQRQNYEKFERILTVTYKKTVDVSSVPGLIIYSKFKSPPTISVTSCVHICIFQGVNLRFDV